jgi:hypothetical protein
VNDAIRPGRELTMTVICKSCEHQYGAWRPRCPACGTSTPVKVQLEQFHNTPRARKAREARTSTSQCVFCRDRGAKQRCPICNERVHGTCLGLHQPECEQFQREVAMEAAKLASVTASK